MKFVRFTFLFAFLLSIFGMSSCDVVSKKNEKKLYLKLNLNYDDIYIYSFHQVQNIKGVGNIDIKQTLDMDMQFQRIDTLNNNHEIKVVFNNIKIKNNSPVGQLDYDSNNPDSNSLIKRIGDIVGQTYYIQFDELGNIDKVINPQAFREGPGNNNDLANIINDSTFSILLRNHFGLYSGKEVKMNNEWTEKTNIMLFNYDIIQESTYRLQKIEKGVASISTRGTLKVPKLKKGQSGEKFKIQLEGQQTGIIQIELKSGVVQSFESKLSLNGTIEMMGQAFPLIIDGETKASSKKIN